MLDWLAVFWLPRSHGDISFGGSGTLIRHAFFGLAAAIGALVVAMVEPSCGTLLVASVGFAELAAACQVATQLCCSSTAPDHNGGRCRKSCGILWRDRIFDGERVPRGQPSFPEGGTRQRPPCRGTPRSDFDSGSFAELSVLGPDRSSGRGLLLSPSRRHDITTRPQEIHSSRLDEKNTAEQKRNQLKRKNRRLLPIPQK